MGDKSIARKIYNYFIQHWFITALILILPTYYLILAETVGKNIGLVAQNNNLTTLGMGIFWPIFIVSLSFALVKSYIDKYNEKIKNNGQYILQKMLSSVNSIVSIKQQRFCEYVAEHHGKNNLDPFSQITQPKRQIRSILENIQICLSEIFDIKREDIGLSIIYKFDTPSNSNWRYLHTMNISNDLNLNELISNPNTTARQIMDGKNQSLFFPDKRIGVNETKFVPGLKDKPHNNVGSIICRDISVDHEEIFVSAVLSITTYGQQICEAKDIYSRYRVENILLPPFETRLRLELSLLYIKNLIAKVKTTP